MTNTLAMFPGQGSQSVGMARTVLDNFPYVKEIFQEAEEATRMPLMRLCLEADASELKQTSNQQPAILTVSIAHWTVLTKETGINPQLFAGHSLGEYSALVASKRLRLFDAAFLVAKRGLAMQDAVPLGLGSMAAVLNCNEKELKDLCLTISQKRGLVVETVNFNTPVQQIISGHKIAVEEACLELKNKSIKTIPLEVSAPFHSSLMAPAKQKMRPLIEKVELSDGRGKIIPNITGEALTSYKKDFLIEQIDHPVQWVKTLNSSEKEGVHFAVEIGPGKVLLGLARRVLPKEVELSGSDDLPSLIKILSAKSF